MYCPSHYLKFIALRILAGYKLCKSLWGIFLYTRYTDFLRATYFLHYSVLEYLSSILRMTETGPSPKHFKLLKPSGYNNNHLLWHQLKAEFCHTVYFGVSCDSHNEHTSVRYSALTDRTYNREGIGSLLYWNWSLVYDLDKRQS
jgi:hypothetical protein